jgi:1,4-dihydroxy-2-naphthoate octaprenyltransferase
MMKKSTLQLLRFHFSFFLMPVYWFALGQVFHKNWTHAIIIFIILHCFVYPASNGYNSFMDRDETSIGGLQNPLQPTRQLFYVTLCMDLIATISAFFVGMYFAAGIFTYILASRAYSYRKIRLKKYPLIGYLTVVIFQGAVIFFLVYCGCSQDKMPCPPALCILTSALLIGGFYPLTQIYQHEADIKDNVKTISYLLGNRGTFIFCGILYSLAFGMMSIYFLKSNQENKLFVLIVAMCPVILYFARWALRVWKDKNEANFLNAMRMNIIASVSINIGFIVVLMMN